MLVWLNCTLVQEYAESRPGRPSGTPTGSEVYGVGLEPGAVEVLNVTGPHGFFSFSCASPAAMAYSSGPTGMQKLKHMVR